MDSILLWVIAALLCACVVLLIVLLVRQSKPADDTALKDTLETQKRALADDLHRETHDMRESIATLGRGFDTHQKELLKLQLDQQEQLHKTLNSQTDKVTETLTQSVEKLQAGNEKKLDEMRATVDEKLSETLSQRLDASFKTVSEQLQNVYKSMGEMKQLAGDVNSLSRVLSNVKTRGTFAEVQLGNLLEQTLTADQFERNVSPKNNGKTVEYAVKIPSKDDDGSFVWLPIDSKFPQEDYLRIAEAAEAGDAVAVEAAAKSLETFIKDQAKKITDLYISVPKTTDFGILFLPTEGLYAEVLRRPGLAETIQTKYRVMICGPTTLTAFLNTLSMGFRTLAINKRASEVWGVLGAVKQQYEKFGGILGKVRKKIDEAGNAIDEAQKRNNQIQSKLRRVETLPENENADAMLGLT
ncbi:MAG: DNA recombination protein RmuC, partial [Clostridia bacterium]|nr:DNA recombination protein RmuC [Clostridia bacterium]